ncbi:MAG TPA: hypothetical protein VF149_08110, partial [Bacillales bacterium]
MAGYDKLDELLDEQKQAYNEMPKFSSVDQIMARIEAQPGKRRRKKRPFRGFIPFAAGIAALFVMTALVLSQLQLNEGRQNASNDPTTNPENTHQKDPGNEPQLFNDDKPGSGNSNDHDDKQQSVFIPDKVPSTINEAKSIFKRMKESGASPSQIDGVFAEYLKNLQQKRNERAGKLQNLINSWAGNNKNTADLEPKFKQPEKIKDSDLRAYVIKIKNWGYSIQMPGGTVELEFAYDKMKAAFSPFLSDTFNQYLQIRANGIVFSENYFAGSW